MIQETGNYCALERRGEDTPSSPMIRKCCCLAQQWCNGLRLRLDELRNHREDSMMPPAACLASQNHKFSISVRPSQLWVSSLLIRYRSYETCSIDIDCEWPRCSNATQWGDNSGITANSLRNTPHVPSDEVDLGCDSLDVATWRNNDATGCVFASMSFETIVRTL